MSTKAVASSRGGFLRETPMGKEVEYWEHHSQGLVTLLALQFFSAVDMKVYIFNIFLPNFNIPSFW